MRLHVTSRARWRVSLGAGAIALAAATACTGRSPEARVDSAAAPPGGTVAAMPPVPDTLATVRAAPASDSALSGQPTPASNVPRRATPPGATPSGTTPSRGDTARRSSGAAPTPRLPVPSRPNDATPSIPSGAILRPPSRPNDATPSIPTGAVLQPEGSPAQSGDSTVSRLEREARALASISGCGSAGDCRVAPLGARACGGPRAYIAYCPLTTDSVRLFRKLAELERAERDYQKRSGTVSICSLLEAPPAGYQGARCTAGSASRGPQ